MIETRLIKKTPFVIEAYDSETEAVLGRYVIEKELDVDYLGRMRVSGRFVAQRPGEGAGSSLLDRTVLALAEYATRKQRRIVHDVILSPDAPDYAGGMFARREYEEHAPGFYSRVYEPLQQEVPIDRLEKKIKERYKTLKKSMPFIGNIIGNDW